MVGIGIWVIISAIDFRDPHWAATVLIKDARPNEALLARLSFHNS